MVIPVYDLFWNLNPFAVSSIQLMIWWNSNSYILYRRVYTVLSLPSGISNPDLEILLPPLKYTYSVDKGWICIKRVTVLRMIYIQPIITYSNSTVPYGSILGRVYLYTTSTVRTLLYRVSNEGKIFQKRDIKKY